MMISGTGALAPRRNDWRARRHPGFLLAMAHRISGIALAAFLPLHFLLIGQALRGASALDDALRLVGPGVGGRASGHLDRGHALTPCSRSATTASA